MDTDRNKELTTEDTEFTEGKRIAPYLIRGSVFSVISSESDSILIKGRPYRSVAK